MGLQSNAEVGRMRQFKSLVLLTLLAGLTPACREDVPDATGPSPSPGSQAVAAAAVAYTIKNLGTLGGHQSVAYDINNMGQTVGTSTTKAGKFHAFIYQAGTMKDLGALSGGTSEANAINDAGVVVGYSTLLSGAERAVRWQNGTKKNLGTLGGRNSRANDINADGTIVGWSDTKSGEPHAFVYQNGVMKDIGTLGGRFSFAFGINNAGKVVGSSTTTSAVSSKDHAFAWANGRMQDLGNGGTLFGEAIAINSGRIVGNFGPSPDSEGGDLEFQQPFIYAAGVFTRFSTRQISSNAKDVNKDGIVVGFDEDERSETRTPDAWVRQSDGTVQYLPELTNGTATAEGINSFGTIVGQSETADGLVAVMWRPQ
jgi:probable HAF family extracellular repeat protein